VIHVSNRGPMDHWNPCLRGTVCSPDIGVVEQRWRGHDCGGCAGVVSYDDELLERVRPLLSGTLMS
jgi:hypothetical protein